MIVTLTCPCGKAFQVKAPASRRRWCSPTCSKRVSLWQQSNPEKHLRITRRWLAKNPARVAVYRSRQSVKVVQKNKAVHLLKLAWHMQELEAAMKTESCLDIFRAEVKDLPTPELRRAFSAGLGIARDQLLRLAAILMELESRGERVEGQPYLVDLLRRIASGELLVDVVVRFAGTPKTLARVARLPVTRQAEALRKSDDEIRGAFGTKKRGGVCTMTSLAGLATAGTPKDVAEMCVELVQASLDPATVAAMVLPRLEKIAKSGRAKTA